MAKKIGQDFASVRSGKGGVGSIGGVGSTRGVGFSTEEMNSFLEDNNGREKGGGGKKDGKKSGKGLLRREQHAASTGIPALTDLEKQYLASLGEAARLTLETVKKSLNALGLNVEAVFKQIANNDDLNI